MKLELWAAIPGYEGFYEASSLGAVRRITRSSNSVEPIRRMTPQQQRFGYLLLLLRKGEKRSGHLVHRLVMAAFHGDSELQVNHKNFDRTDNRLVNLEYVTRAENMAHAKAADRHTRGERQGRAKLTDAKVREIRSRIAAGSTLFHFYKQYGVSFNTAWHAATGATWKHVK